MKLANVLVIQFRQRSDTAKLEQQSIRREISDSIELHFLSALVDEISWLEPETVLHNIDGVIFGGSGDFYFDGGRADNDESKQMSKKFLKKLKPLLSHIFEHDIPTLGICYGHQLIGAYAGADVVHDIDQTKNCSHQLEVIAGSDNYAICENVPQSFFAHYGHKDSLDRVPAGAVLLCSGGDKCKVPALRYKQNIYTTQFHPELNFADMLLRIEATPGYLPEGTIVDEAFVKDTDSSQILKNFGKLVLENKR